MRTYQPIWEQIKKESKASIVVDSALHTRIIKAVRKEKDMDIGWKLLTGEESKKYKLREDIKESIITFYLDDVSPIGINDL